MGWRAAETLDPSAGFFQLGMDSLMSVTLQRSLTASLGITLPAAVIYESPTIWRLTDALCERMGYVTAAEIPAKVHPASGHGPSNAPGPARKLRRADEEDMGIAMYNDHPTASDELPPNAIAVIGMAGRFPGANSVTTFWDNLRRGEESIATLSEEGSPPRASVRRRWPIRPTFGARPCSTGSTSSTRNTSGCTPQAARMMDPQQRLFLQTAWHAFEDAGYDPADVRRIDRRLRDQYRQRLPAAQPDVAPRPECAHRRGHHLRHVQPGLAERQGLPGDAGVAPVQPARTRASRCRPPARRRWSRCTWRARAC